MRHGEPEALYFCIQGAVTLGNRDVFYCDTGVRDLRANLGLVKKDARETCACGLLNINNLTFCHDPARDIIYVR